MHWGYFSKNGVNWIFFFRQRKGKKECHGSTGRLKLDKIFTFQSGCYHHNFSAVYECLLTSAHIHMHIFMCIYLFTHVICATCLWIWLRKNETKTKISSQITMVEHFKRNSLFTWINLFNLILEKRKEMMLKWRISLQS